MNTKLSQFPFQTSLNGNEVFPILSNGNNFIAPVSAVYTFLSGDKLIDVATSYTANSSYFLNGSNVAFNVYSSYNQNSGNYITNDSLSVEDWNLAYGIVNQNYVNWNNATTFTSGYSSYAVQSNTTLVPNSSAVTNIVVITQANYDALTSIDPYTFYIIAS
jgi:hypothetical protein